MSAPGKTVFELNEDDANFTGLHIANDHDIKRAVREHRFRGATIVDTWRPMAIAPVRDASYLTNRKPVGDCSVIYGTIPVFSAKAADCLINFLAPNGELLPMDFLGEEWFGFNVTTVVDVLDHSCSQVVYFPGTSRAMLIDRYAFVPGSIQHAIFKIPEDLSVTLVTEEFMNAVLAARLGGLAFKKVWSLGRNLDAAPK